MMALMSVLPPSQDEALADVNTDNEKNDSADDGQPEQQNAMMCNQVIVLICFNCQLIVRVFFFLFS